MALAICAMFGAIGAARLFRAFRLRESSRAAFIAHLVCGVVFWACATIGFGDLTPTTDIGRLLSMILGLYGIVVVALITSIIVSFYGEVKKEDTKHTDGGVNGGPAPSAD